MKTTTCGRKPTSSPSLRASARRVAPAGRHLPERRVVVIDEDASASAPGRPGVPTPTADPAAPSPRSARRSARARVHASAVGDCSAREANDVEARWLGRGLSALIPGAPEAGEASGLLEVPVNAVSPNPKQPRTRWDDDEIQSLAASIREVGILQPIVVRVGRQRYELWPESVGFVPPRWPASPRSRWSCATPTTPTLCERR